MTDHATKSGGGGDEPRQAVAGDEGIKITRFHAEGSLVEDEINLAESKRPARASVFYIEQPTVKVIDQAVIIGCYIGILCG